MTNNSLLSCGALVRRYGRTRALDGVDLELESGAPIALVGPNGAGKTTLFSVLCGYVRPTSGEVRVLGHRPGSAALRGQLGALPQDASLAPRRTIGAQLEDFARLQGMSRLAARSERERVLDVVDLAGSARQLPDSLSHGMGKRVAFAQSLIGSPRLVLLDEPTAGVDPPNVRVIHGLIREMAGQIDFMISSHNLDELERLTDRVVYLDSGRVSSRGAIASDDGGDSQVGRLTITLETIEASVASEAADALTQLDSVSTCRTTPRGDLVAEVVDEDRAARDVIDWCAEHKVRWRRLARGRSLEARLYDD
jgi:ABC-2 type transport system ATP-binding protein